MLPQVEDSTNDAQSIVGDTPKTGAGNLGYETVSTESAKDAADLGAGLFGVRGVRLQVRSHQCQPLTDVAITKTTRTGVALILDIYLKLPERLGATGGV